MCLFVIFAEIDGIDRACVLAKTAENAAPRIYLILDGIAFPVEFLADLQRNALVGTGSHALTACDAGRLARLIFLEVMYASPSFRHFVFLFGVLVRNGLRKHP